MPWDQALDAVASAGRLGADEFGDVIVVRRNQQNAYFERHQKVYIGEKIAFDSVNEDVHNIIHRIGRASGKNIAVTDAVKAKVTLGLTDMPWDQALDVVTAASGLAAEVSGGIILVDTKWRDASVDRPAKVYTGKKITLDFVNENVHNIIRRIGRASGKNIAVTGAVKADVTLGLTDIPWDQALDLVVGASSLGAYESDGIILIDTKRHDTSADRPAKVYTGKKITLDSVNEDIHNIIRRIGKVSGKKIVVSGNVSGDVTLGLVDVPWDQALDVVAAAGKLGADELGDVIVVRPNKRNGYFERHPKVYTGEKITFNSVKEDVHNIIRRIGQASGKNIVVTDAVKADVTLGLTDMPWDQALDVVATANDLAAEVSGDIILVDTKQRGASTDRPAKVYAGKTITLDSINEDIHKIISMIGKFSDKNIVVSDSARARVTLGLTDVHWDQALDLVMDASHLSANESDGIILIDTEQYKTPADRQPKVYTGEKITLNVVNEDVSNVLLMIAEVSGKSIVIPDDVKGRVTLGLTDVPWDQALDAVVAVGHFVVEESGGVIAVYDRHTYSILELSRKLGPLEWSATAGSTPGSNQLLTTVLDKADALLLNALLSSDNPHFRTISAPRIMAANDQTVSIKQGQQIPYQSGSSATTAANVQFRGGYNASSSSPSSVQSVPGSAPSVQTQHNQSRSGETSIASDPLRPAMKSWLPNAPYNDRLQAAKDDELYAIYLDERPDYMGSSAFFIDVADHFFERGFRDMGLRVLSNLAEIQLENRRLLRLLAYRLMREGEMAAALPVLERVRELAPYEPQSLRDLAAVKAGLGQIQAAVDLLYETARGQWSSRFGSINTIALTEMNALIATHERQVKTGDIDSRLIKNLASDIRIVLSWDTDDTNFDLRVIAPDGEVAQHGHYSTKIGGRLSDNCSQGYGPEEFMLKKAMPGVYRVEVNYSGDSRQTMARGGESTAMITVYTKFGTPKQSEQMTILRMKKTGSKSLIAEFTIKE